MGSGLKGNDLLFAQQMRELGVAQKIRPDMIDQSKGVILIACGDCDHSVDIFNHTRKMHAAEESQAKVHLLTINGGPLVLVKDSPLNGSLPVDEMWLDQIAATIVLKNIDQIILMPHGVCGAAMTLGGMSFEEVYREAYKAHERVRNEALARAHDFHRKLAKRASECENIRAIVENFSVERLCTRPYMHHHLPDGTRETRFFNRDAFRCFLELTASPKAQPVHPYQALREQFPERVFSGIPRH